MSYHVDTDQNAKGKWRWVIYSDDNRLRAKSGYRFTTPDRAFKRGAGKRTLLLLQDASYVERLVLTNDLRSMIGDVIRAQKAYEERTE